MKPANLLENLPADLSREVFETLVDADSVKIERIVSRGHASPASGWYDQEQHEWVIVLQGEALLCFDGEPDVRLRAGDYIHIPAHTRHRVAWTRADEVTIWLAVHYGP